MFNKNQCLYRRFCTLFISFYQSICKPIEDEDIGYQVITIVGPQMNRSRYSSIVVYLMSGYSSVASTPKEGSILQLAKTPLTKTACLRDNTKFSGDGKSRML
uniref:Uncharacterized protein n=1 Tax=Opuntia streptacantha TaxID=393608 RepID=A0A7C9CIR7_OPUST